METLCDILHMRNTILTPRNTVRAEEYICFAHKLFFLFRLFNTSNVVSFNYFLYLCNEHTKKKGDYYGKPYSF